MQTLFSLEPDSAVRPEPFAVAQEALSIYDAMNQATVIDVSDDIRHAVQLCLAFYSVKVQRVTRAALTLVLTGQGEEAMGLIREQNDFVIALNYYHDRPDQAVLFMVSEVLQKRDRARQVMAFDEKARLDPARQEQLAELERKSEQAYSDFPDLRRPKGKSGSSASPILIDWSEPDSKAMLKATLSGWLRKHYVESVQTFTDEQFEDRLETLVERTYFMRSTFISQGKHGTAFSLGNAIGLDDARRILPTRWQVEDPSRLAYHFVSNALPALKTICQYNQLEPTFEERLNKLGSAYRALGEALGIEHEAIPPIEEPI
jgi:hypothetical protein